MKSLLFLQVRSRAVEQVEEGDSRRSYRGRFLNLASCVLLVLIPKGTPHNTFVAMSWKYLYSVE